MNSPSIEAVNLSKRYGSFLALSNLSLKIEGSKCVGFLGPNGAGKTTTLKIFTDLINATQGEALINGVNVHKNKKAALASCSALIETPEIYPSLTPKEALMMIAETRGVLREVSDVCDEVAMIDHGKLIVYDTLANVTNRFSGGANLVEVGLLAPVNAVVTTKISSIPGVVSVEIMDDKNLKIKFKGDLAAQ